jgi:hypothetical protein
LACLRQDKQDFSCASERPDAILIKESLGVNFGGTGMEKIQIDANMRSKLGSMSQHIELCDEAGHTVGHSLPAAIYDDLFFKALARETPYSPEELRRRFQETGGRPLRDIWRDLGRAS